MKTILCDIGGVLLHVDFQTAITRLSSKTGLAGQELMDRIFSSGLKDMHDRGLIIPLEFYRQTVPAELISFEEFRSIWADIFTENEEMVDFIKACPGKYRLYIASNTDPIHFDFFNETYPWFSLFDGYGLSFRMTALKPSPEFHVKLCREFGIEYKDALFVDDLRENVVAANGLGIRSHLYKGFAGFKEFVESV